MEMRANSEFSPEQAREIGKTCFFQSDGDTKTKNYGLKLILQAHSMQDPEATYLVARFLLDGIITISSKNREDHALTLMCSAANNGCIQARAYLNAYCQARYRDACGAFSTTATSGMLVDFDGKPIKVNRQGIFTPIDAVLDCEAGKHTLTLRTNVVFVYGEDFAAAEKFERAVRKGLRSWGGEYEVFGGQKLSVKVQLTNDDNLFDNLLIVPVIGDVRAAMQNIGGAIGSEEKKTQIADLIKNKRSFAVSGFRWSVNSRKIIFIQSANGLFDDFEEIAHVAKHEFGHALGLGDLYASPADALGGVRKGTFAELDSYAITDKYYNLVMCDHHGPISNNDIEMVILAFRENQIQLYQPSKLKGKISTALGKGN